MLHLFANMKEMMVLLENKISPQFERKHTGENANDKIQCVDENKTLFDFYSAFSQTDRLE